MMEDDEWSPSEAAFLDGVEEARATSRRLEEVPIVEAMSMLRHVQNLSDLPPSKRVVDHVLDMVREIFLSSAHNLWGQDVGKECDDKDVRRWLVSEVAQDQQSRVALLQTPRAPPSTRLTKTPSGGKATFEFPAARPRSGSGSVRSVASMRNAYHYMPKDAVYAFRIGTSVNTETEGGRVEGGPRDWIVVNKTAEPTHGIKTLNIVKESDFHTLYRRAPRTLNTYVRRGAVLAVRLERAQSVTFDDGMQISGKKGDFLVQREDDSKTVVQEFMTPEEFHERYTIDEEATEHREDMSPIEVSPPLAAPDERALALVAPDRLSTWCFPVFELDALSGGNALLYMGRAVFDAYGLLDVFGLHERELDAFLWEVQRGYSDDNPYHNALHAADVLHAMYCMTGAVMRADERRLPADALLAASLAAIMHDHRHPGVNNAFVVETESDLARKYNDQHVLEMHHLSTGFVVLRRSGLFRSAPKHLYRKVRSIIVEMVLATDSTLHFEVLEEFVGKVDVLNAREDDDRLLLLKVLMRAADINHPAKSGALHANWRARIMKEWQRQGEQEARLGLRVSPFMDKSDDSSVRQSQLSWIHFVVRPLFDGITTYIRNRRRADADDEEGEEREWLKCLDENQSYYERK